MKYRCLFMYKADKYLGPCWAHADINTDCTISEKMLQEIEKNEKVEIENALECEIYDFHIVAWSKIAEGEKE